MTLTPNRNPNPNLCSMQFMAINCAKLQQNFAVLLNFFGFIVAAQLKYLYILQVLNGT